MRPAPESQAAADVLADMSADGDSVLIVHSAFAGLNRAGLRAEDFIDALLERLGTGTLLMPAMTWRSVTPANPVFDELKTPSHTGALTEVFRMKFSQTRSLHPTHSVAGSGSAAARLLDGHHVDDTPCSANSPYGRMRAADSWVLLLGVGLEMCTAIHHAEELVAPDLYLQPPRAVETYQCRDRNGHVRQVRTRRHVKLNRDFPQFAPRLAALDRLRTGDTFGTRWQLMRLDDLYGIVFGALAQRRDATLAQPTPVISPAYGH